MFFAEWKEISCYNKWLVKSSIPSSYSSSFPLKHSALTSSFHLPWSLAALFASFEVMLIVFNKLVVFFSMSNMVFLSSVSSVGSSPRLGGWCLQTCSQHMVCPIHLPLSPLDCVSDGSCLILCQSSWLEMCSGYLMSKIWRQILMKTFSLWSNFLVFLQVYNRLYKRTDLILLMDSLSLVQGLKFLLLHTGLRVAKAWHALLILQ